MAASKTWLIGLPLIFAACEGGHRIGDLSGGATSGAGEDADAGTPSTGELPPATADGNGTTTTAEDDSSGGDEDTDAIKNDVAAPDDVPIIPVSCNDAIAAESTIGCEFYAQDLGDLGLSDAWSIVVSNVQQFSDATVTLERRVGGVWVEEASATIDPLDLLVFDPQNTFINDTILVSGMAYRITSDVPTVAYQINPSVGGDMSGDASLLYPVAGWDDHNAVIGWDNGTAAGMVYFTVVAAFDGTDVLVEPSAATRASSGGDLTIPAMLPGESFELTLDAGDQVTFFGANTDEALTGSLVTSLDEDKPVAVFSGARCVYIPAGIGACDHIETQLSGMQQWGKRFAAARVPVRDTDTPETSVWHIYARDDNTTLQFHADPAVTGLPAGPTTLAAGELLELWVGGDEAHPGDFFVEADEPIAVVNYMTGANNLPPDMHPNPPGDPAMMQLLATEQFEPLYVVLVPPGWGSDYLVLTREEGSTVNIDGVAVDDAAFTGFAPGFEVARVPVEDGVHMVDSTEPLGISVVGYDVHDSYAYVGGGGTAVLNPEG